MKKTMKCFVALLMMVMAFTVTGITAEAAENVKREFNNKIDDGITLNASQKMDRFGDADSYAGGYVTGLKQTAATLTSVTLTWNPVAGAASYYVVSVENGYVTSILTEVQTNSITLNVPENTYGAGVGIVPIDANGNASVSYGLSLKVYSQPKKVTGLAYNGSFASGNKLNVIWEDSVCYGFEAVLYNKKGKAIQKVDESYYRNVKFSKSNTQNIYTVKVRPYVYINGGAEKLYGEYSKTFYAVPQPKITSKESDIKINSFKLKWKKVNGATKYDIYVSTKKNKGYKKVATVKKNAKSYNITKYKGKTINTLKNTYYIKIVTYGKFGKKTVKSKSASQIRVYSYYY